MAENEHNDHNLNSRQKRDARSREAPSAAVVYEAIRRESASELTRPLTGLAFSALAAGLSMGFSFLAQALLYSYTPESAWRPIIASFGYSLGFLFVILSRQQLFTENTLTPVLEVLRVRRWSTVARTHAQSLGRGAGCQYRGHRNLCREHRVLRGTGSQDQRRARLDCSPRI